ncbi:MAG: hypothetical protein J6S21_04455 [Victivallales bacterium]|nr:hypothetical protein [Victivallales bacterium]
MPLILSILTALMLASCAPPESTAAAAKPDGSNQRIISASPDAPHRLSLLLEGPESPDVTSELTLTVECSFPAGSTLRGHDLTPEKLPAFKVTPLKTEAAPQQQEEGTVTLLSTYRLDPWIAESYTIPAVTAEFTDARGDTVKATAPECALEIAQMSQEFWSGVQISDTLKPYSTLPLTPAEKRRLACYGAAGIIAAALIALLIIRVIRARLARLRQGPPPETPYQRACRLLDELLNEHLMTRGEYRLYCFKISNILRQYIEERFSLSAPRLTTQEFLEKLGNAPKLSPHRLPLRRFLTASDMVKFAAAVPGDGEADELASLCREFLNHTNLNSDENVPS